jgi:hypothetical protein
MQLASQTQQQALFQALFTPTPVFVERTGYAGGVATVSRVVAECPSSVPLTVSP